MTGYLALGFVIGFSTVGALYLLVYWQYEQVCDAIKRASR